MTLASVGPYPAAMAGDSTETLRQGCIRSYSPIALDYYSQTHHTTRNFDAATAGYFHNERHMMPRRITTVVDLGAGRGSSFLVELPADAITVEIDASIQMLQLNRASADSRRVCGDALEIPLMAGCAEVVTSFLFDPFNTPTFAGEVRRLLRSDGLFIGSVPSAIWAHTFRRLIGLACDEAIFRLPSRQDIVVRSLVCPPEELLSRFLHAGFRHVVVNHATLRQTQSLSSRQVKLVAAHLGIDDRDLPIVDIVVARC